MKTSLLTSASTWLIGLLVSVIFYFKYFTFRRSTDRRLKQEVIRRQKAEKLSQLRLHSLTHQFKPHFVFNSLNTLDAYIIKEDKRAASSFLNQFSKLLRLVIKNSKEDLISLDQEIAVLKAYLQVEIQRYKGKFTYQIDIDQTIDLKSFKVPPLFIQHLVEEKIWLSLSEVERKSYIKISLYSNHNMDQIYCDIIASEKDSTRVRSITPVEPPSASFDTLSKLLHDRNEALSTNFRILQFHLLDSTKSIIGTKITLAIPHIENDPTSTKQLIFNHD